jgi:hypothetical protein
MVSAIAIYDMPNAQLEVLGDSSPSASRVTFLSFKVEAQAKTFSAPPLTRLAAQLSSRHLRIWHRPKREKK